MENPRGAHASGPSPESSAPPTRDVVTVPSRQGLEAADLMRLTTGVGPVLHDRTDGSLGFLVPPGTAEEWDVPGSRCHHTDGEPAPAGGAGWLVPPPADAAVTDPDALREALGEAARTLRLTDGLDPDRPDED